MKLIQTDRINAEQKTKTVVLKVSLNPKLMLVRFIIVLLILEVDRIRQDTDNNYKL